MFQSFEVATRPADGPPRLAALREQIQKAGLDGFLVPRSDAHRGEYVAPHDERLAWLTGFTGSAGFCAVLEDVAGVFVDGRYRVQVRSQVDLAHFTPVAWPKVTLAEWLLENLPEGGQIGFDPWLHSVDEIDKLQVAGAERGIKLIACENLLDAIWEDQPAPPAGEILVHPLELAGKPHGEKRQEIGAAMAETGVQSAVLTLPDSIAWLLNIRGSDIVRNPIPHAFAILHQSGRVDLFCSEEKVTGAVKEHLGPETECGGTDAFEAALQELRGKVQIDPASVPVRVADLLSDAEIVHAPDPCALPKACKNAAELAGMEAAHLRDGAAMCRFLCWLESEAPKGSLTEIDVVRRLEQERRKDPLLRDISFETICGSGPHGAIVHYRVSEETNRRIAPGEILLVDSGGQYADGTTDITRTVATGLVGAFERACFTRVLQGMIALSTARWPKGLAGRDLDALARAPLWRAGQDYDHGTGHGVGAYLSVHEGPQRISRTSDIALQEGMILSNEPGYYREGAFGIRIENLLHVLPAPPLPDADDRAMLAFGTLTWVPIDRRMIEVDMLTGAERDWLDVYHAECRRRIGPLLKDDAATWLDVATAPL